MSSLFSGNKKKQVETIISRCWLIQCSAYNFILKAWEKNIPAISAWNEELWVTYGGGGKGSRIVEE